MFYTLGQAAKATSKSKPTLSRAIQSGRMSGQKQLNGSYLIDPAELHRVFPPVSSSGNATGDMKLSETQSNPSILQAQLETLREERERERQQLQATIDDLRRRLDSESEARENAAAEIRRLTLMLTHSPKIEPEAQPAPTANQNDHPAPVRLWLWVVLAAVLIGAVFALWLAYGRPLP
mgnify:CR=1 FL=1